MNVNGINPDEIRAQAQNLLKNQDKVDLKQEDLEVLWANAKLTNDSALFDGVSDEDAIAMFDTFDNEGNTAGTSYKMLMEWLKDNSGLDIEINTGDVAEEEPTTEEPATEEPTTEEPTTEEPATEEPTTEEPATEEPVAEEPTTEEPAAEDAPVLPEGERQFLQMRAGASETIDVNGKKYIIENASSTVNNVFYYIENGQFIVEGSDLKVVAGDNEDKADNVKVLGNRNTVDMGDGDDVIEIEGDMNMLYGGGGDDLIKMRGDYNTTDMSDGDDTVWMDGNGNVAMGQGGGDNFFAIGDSNTFMGQDDTDASYYNETRGVGHEFRVEETIGADDPRVKDFEDWVNGEDPSGPPYTKPPKAAEGHEVRQYDDMTYTDKYEEEPYIKTEYRDIAYRELQAKTSENKETGDGRVEKVTDAGTETTDIDALGNVKIVAPDGSIVNIASEDVKYVDSSGERVDNPGSMAEILAKLATGELRIDVPDFTKMSENARLLGLGIPQAVIDQGEDAIEEYAKDNDIDLS